MKTWLLSVVLVSVLLQTFADVPKVPKKGKREEVRQSIPVDEEEKTLLIKVDYAFETESIVYDKVQNKRIKFAVKMAGNFSFETLHHDFDGTMLGRMTLTNCTTNNCGSIPPIYIAFHQGGNNIIESFVDLTDHKEEDVKWNVVFAIINSIYTPAEYGEGDEQRVDTIYGKCRTQFGRPEDKRFRRIIDNCNVAPLGALNKTRIDGIEVVSYDQDVWYTQNTKVNADIVLIDAIEALEFRIPFQKEHGFVMESRIHVTIQNRNQDYVTRHCPSTTSTSACAVEAFGVKSVGKKLYEGVSMGKEQIDTLSQYSYEDLHLVSRKISNDKWLEIVKKAEKSDVDTIATVLGNLGTADSINVAKVLLEAHPEAIGAFSIAVANSLSTNGKWHKEIMYLLTSEEGKPAFWPLANAFAAVLNRKCQRSAAACENGKDLIVNKFYILLEALPNKDKVLTALGNLPLTRSFEYAKSLICTREPTEVQIAAINVIRKADKKNYDSKLFHTLTRLFRNTCPLKVSTKEANLAVDALLRALPESQNVASLLLRSETNQPENHEKWRYFYEAVNSTSERDELTAEFWQRMRSFKVFKPNYAQRALRANSFSDWRHLFESAGYKVQLSTKSDFAPTLTDFENFEFNVDVKKGRRELELFGLNYDLYRARQRKISLLGANFDITNINEAHVPLREVSFHFPLISGLVLDVESNNILSLGVHGTHAKVTLKSEMSACLRNDKLVTSSVHSTQSVNTDLTLESTNVGCIVASTSGFQFSGKTEVVYKEHEKTLVRTRELNEPGFSFNFDQKLSQNCRK